MYTLLILTHNFLIRLRA